MHGKAGRQGRAGPSVAPTPWRCRWLLCGALALTLHAVVLSNPFQAFGATADEAAQRHTRPIAVQARLVPPPPVATVTEEPAAEETDAEEADAEPAPDVGQPVEESSEPPPRDDAAPAAPAIPEGRAPEVDPLPPGLLARGDAPPPPEGDAPAEFVPRSLLTRGPVPLSAVLLTYPEFRGDPGHHVAILTLFIDEFGVVRQVTVDPPGLPVELEAVARRAFLETRFQPGERDGVRVRSRMRVEVRFDSGLPP